MENREFYDLENHVNLAIIGGVAFMHSIDNNLIDIEPKIFTVKDNETRIVLLKMMGKEITEKEFVDNLPTGSKLFDKNTHLYIKYGIVLYSAIEHSHERDENPTLKPTEEMINEFIGSGKLKQKTIMSFTKGTSVFNIDFDDWENLNQR